MPSICTHGDFSCTGLHRFLSGCRFQREGRLRRSPISFVPLPPRARAHKSPRILVNLCSARLCGIHNPARSRNTTRFSSISILTTRRDQKFPLITEQRAANSQFFPFLFSLFRHRIFYAQVRTLASFPSVSHLFPFSRFNLCLFPSPATVRRCLRINDLETR